MPKNIDDFNTMAGLILAHLYKAFPRRVFIDGTGFISSEETGPDWLKDYHDSLSLYASSMLWLRDAGYIWVEGEHHPRASVFRGCVLSPKGLEALKAVPHSLSGESFGDSLLTAAKSGALETLKGLASELVSQSYKVVVGAAAAHL